MKIIDLLNKIANEEDVPKYIKVYDDIYEYDNFNNLYWNSNNKQLLDVYNGRILNYEVEIIEENKIPDEIKVKDFDKCIHDVTHKEKEFSLDIRELQIRYNELLNYLKSKGE